MRMAGGEGLDCLIASELDLADDLRLEGRPLDDLPYIRIDVWGTRQKPEERLTGVDQGAVTTPTAESAQP